MSIPKLIEIGHSGSVRLDAAVFACLLYKLLRVFWIAAKPAPLPAHTYTQIVSFLTQSSSNVNRAKSVASCRDQGAASNLLTTANAVPKPISDELNWQVDINNVWVEHRQHSPYLCIAKAILSLSLRQKQNTIFFSKLWLTQVLQ